MPNIIQKSELKYDPELLNSLTRGFADEVDFNYLANRSEVDPRHVTSEDFLSLLYNKKTEKVYVTHKNSINLIEKEKYCLWPDDSFENYSKKGVWFLPQPVDGIKREKLQYSVSSWRYVVLKNDLAPAMLWLSSIVRIVPRVTAITFSGKSKIHALVRIDAPSENAMHKQYKLISSLSTIGTYVASPLEFTRLPACHCKDKLKIAEQKLLYFSPSSPPLTISDMCIRRSI